MVKPVGAEVVDEAGTMEAIPLLIEETFWQLDVAGKDAAA